MAAVFDGQMTPPLEGLGGSGSGHGAAKYEDSNKFKAQIIQDVDKRLQQAKQETERKVSAELKFLHTAMQEMDKRLDALNQRLEDVQTPSGECLEESHVIQALAKVEQQWGKELGKLKSELHQMIFAHNHNADLMKHQKETLERIRHETFARAAPSTAKVPLAMAKAKVDSAREHVKAHEALYQEKLEPLLPRMAALEMAVARWQASGQQQQNYYEAPTRPPMFDSSFAGLEPDSPEEDEEQEEDDVQSALGSILSKGLAVYETSSTG